MYLDTKVGRRPSGGGKLLISSTGKHPWLRLTMLEPYDGHWHWHSVSLKPDEAIWLANRLLAPLPDQWEDYVDPPPGPKGKMYPVWDVVRVHRGGGFATTGHGSCLLGVQARTIAFKMHSWDRTTKPGQTTHFWPSHLETFSEKEVKQICGILYHWAGAMMIGYKKQTKTETYDVLAIAKGD